MRRILGLTAALALALFPMGIGAIDTPPGAEDLRAGIEPLAKRFDAAKGRHRLVLLLSPA